MKLVFWPKCVTHLINLEGEGGGGRGGGASAPPLDPTLVPLLLTDMQKKDLACN